MKAFLPSLAVALVLLSAGIDGQVVIRNTLSSINWNPFDCTRGSGLPCFGQGSCRGRTCTCFPNMLGHDCRYRGGLSGQYINNAQCTTLCSAEGGRCYRSSAGGQDACHCLPLYGGRSCSVFRGHVQCHTNQVMTVDVYPQPQQGDFSGFVSAESQTNPRTLLPSPECKGFVTEPNKWDGIRFRLNISTANNNPCGAILQPGNPLKVCVAVRLQYSQVYYTTVDEHFTFCCNRTTTVGDGVFTVDDGGAGHQIELTGTVNILRSGLYRMNGITRLTEIQRGELVPFGQTIAFVVGLNGVDSRYTDLRLERCVANGNIPLVQGRCPADRSLVSDLRLVTDTFRGPEIYLDMTTWRPSGTNLVTIRCEAIACVGSCGSVTPTCVDNIMNYGRRRRQAGTSDEEKHENVNRSFYIIEGPESKPCTCPVEESSCPVNGVQQVFIPVAVVFGVLLLLALGTSGFLCYKLRRPRAASVSVTEKQAYYNDGCK